MEKELFIKEVRPDIYLLDEAHDYDDISLMRCLRKGVQEIIDGNRMINHIPGLAVWT